MTPRTLAEICGGRVDAHTSNEQRAAECLQALESLPAEDLARPDYRCAAQTFALLAIADALHSPGAGYNVAAAILATGGIQP